MDAQFLLTFRRSGLNDATPIEPARFAAYVGELQESGLIEADMLEGELSVRLGETDLPGFGKVVRIAVHGPGVRLRVHFEWPQTQHDMDFLEALALTLDLALNGYRRTAPSKIDRLGELTGQATWECSVCDRQFGKLFECMQHERHMHPSVAPTPDPMRRRPKGDSKLEWVRGRWRRVPSRPRG